MYIEGCMRNIGSWENIAGSSCSDNGESNARLKWNMNWKLGVHTGAWVFGCSSWLFVGNNGTEKGIGVQLP